MEITESLLIDKNACGEGVEWFAKSFPNGADHTDVIDRLVEGKDTNGWIAWILETFRLSGKAQRWYENGQLSRDCTFKKGLHHGRYQSWYENGKPEADCKYRDGKEQGRYKAWYATGQLMEDCTYKDGKRQGRYQSWYENGELIEDCIYKNGLEVLI